MNINPDAYSIYGAKFLNNARSLTLFYFRLVLHSKTPMAELQSSSSGEARV